MTGGLSPGPGTKAEPQEPSAGAGPALPAAWPLGSPRSVWSPREPLARCLPALVAHHSFFVTSDRVSCAHAAVTRVHRRDSCSHRHLSLPVVDAGRARPRCHRRVPPDASLLGVGTAVCSPCPPRSVPLCLSVSSSPLLTRTRSSWLRAPPVTSSYLSALGRDPAPPPATSWGPGVRAVISKFGETPFTP